MCCIESFSLLRDCCAAVHFVVEGRVVLVALLLAFTGHAGVSQVLGDAVGPAVGDGVFVAVISLGDFDFWDFLGV